MTNDEILLTHLSNTVNELMKLSKTPIRWFLAVGRPGVDLFSGNCCTVCVHEALGEWIEDNNVGHLKEEAESETKH